MKLSSTLGLASTYAIVSLLFVGTVQAYINPIVPGFNPDPSILRVEDDYWLVTSSFTFTPGIPIYHSTDLVNWTLHSHALTRPEQTAMFGTPTNLGRWKASVVVCWGSILTSVSNQVSGLRLSGTTTAAITFPLVRATQHNNNTEMNRN